MTIKNAAKTAAKLVIVRPYGDWIRDHVVEILQAAGIAAELALVIPETADDAEVVHAVGPDTAAILVPFHALRDEQATDGYRTGLTALVALRDSGRLRRGMPIVMPVSQFGRLGFSGFLSRAKPSFRHWFDDAVCMLPGPFDREKSTHIAALQTYLANLNGPKRLAV